MTDRKAKSKLRARLEALALIGAMFALPALGILWAASFLR